jgi:hypothetical protein
MFEAIILPLTLLGWIAFGVGIARKRIRPSAIWTFLWLLSGALGMQVLLALVFDMFGGVGFGTNTAVRLIPIYLIPGACFATMLIYRTATNTAHGRRIVVTCTACLIFGLAIAAPLRAFVDPSVSPLSWVPYDAEERNAASWLHSYIAPGVRVFSQSIYAGSPETRIGWLTVITANPASTERFLAIYPANQFTAIPAGSLLYSSDREETRRSSSVYDWTNVSLSKVYEDGKARFYWNP